MQSYLGLESPDLFSEIHELIVPKYENEDSGSAHDDYFGDLEKMFRAYEQSEAGQKRGRLISQLKDLPFIRSVKLETGEQRLQKPTEVYLNTADLREYFAGNDSAWFVSEALMEHFETAALMSFLKELGVATCPRRIKFDPDLSEKEKRQYRIENDRRYNGKITRKWGEPQEDFDIDGLNAFLREEVTPDRSTLLWRLLPKRVGSSGRYYFKGKYEWKYQSWRTARFPAKFYKTLTKTLWLFDAEGNRKRPSQLTPSQMASDYNLESDGADSLLKHLDFKDEAEVELPERSQQILEHTRKYGLSPEDIEKLGREKQKASSGETEPSDDEWTPEVAAGEAGLTIMEPPTVVEDRPDLRGQSASKGNGKQPRWGDSKKKSEPDAGKESHQRSRNDGKWGEEVVFEALLKEYDAAEDEVVWLNENGEAGKGCDIVIKQNGREAVFIEVKSRMESNPEWVQITKTQWEFARRLHSEDGDEDEEYWVFVVPGARTPDARILKLKNPIEQWKRGERLAHPINLKVR